MKYFKRQYSLDFEQAIWEHDPELLIMDQILDQNPQIIMLAATCFPKACDELQVPVGRDGMTLEQVVRCAIYQRHKRLTYRQLSDHTEDSKKGRSFMKMEYNQYFSPQALQENISKISSEVLENIHIAIAQYAIDLGIDDGKKVRTDSTTIKTNIHYPTNASLLWDCIRVCCRLLKETKDLLIDFNFRSYQKSAKKLLFKIVNTGGKKNRRPFFKKMLQTQRRCEGWVEKAIEQLSSSSFPDAEQENNGKNCCNIWMLYCLRCNRLQTLLIAVNFWLKMSPLKINCSQFLKTTLTALSKVVVKRYLATKLI